MSIGQHRRALRSLVAGTALVMFMTGTAGAVLVAAEDFETASMTTYHGSGVGRDCSRPGSSGACSVKIDPVCCSQYVHSETPVDATMNGATTVSYAFSGDSTTGDLDSFAVVRLDTGAVTLDVTDGISSNTGVSLHSDGFASRSRFSSWSSAGSWHGVTLKLDPAADTVTATVNGRTATTGIRAAATKITRVEFWGVRWSTFGWPMRYDALKVENADPPPNTAPSVALVRPAAGETLPFHGPHTFEVRATDAENDAYSARIYIRDPRDGSVEDILETPTVASGLPASAQTHEDLPPGDWDWSAVVTDARGAVRETPLRRFHVAHLAYAAGVYVALGDSYSSGEGAPEEYPENFWVDTFEGGTDEDDVNECHRSGNAWPRLIAKSPSLPSRMDFAACSGAVARQVTADSRWNEPPQITHLNADTTLVTISIGGNDAGFAKVLDNCVKTFGSDCNPTWEPYVSRRLKRLGAPQGSHASAADRTADPEIDGVQPLSEVYQLIRGAAPHARVVVVGYPTFFQPGGYGSTCSFIRQNDQVWMNEKVAEINDVIEDRAVAAGFEYADVEHAFAGHHLCADGEDWMNGINDVDIRYAFHPNHLGHSAEAAIVLNVIENPPSTKHTVRQGATTSTTADVPPGQRKMTAATRWPGSDVALTLRSPSGRTISRGTVAADVERATGPTSEVVTVTDPEPGTWTIEMYGVDVPEAGEPTELTVTTREALNERPAASFTYQPGGINTVTVDGTASADPDGSITAYEWSWGDGTTSTGATATHRYAAPGTYEITLVVRDDRGGLGISPSASIEVTGYSFGGYGAPVDPAPTLNRMKAGRAIPLKWRITDAAGTPIADPGSFVQVTSAQVPCDADAPIDILDEEASTTSGLQYSGDGNWQYNWKTDPSWAGTCRRMTVRLDDGATADRSALFDFR